MTFHGLFIGIDHYASQGINQLGCAKRDAVALHALFTDTLGGETVVLVDEQATRLSIEREFRQLQQCAPDDVVVIAFAGHGSESHELVTYDTDPAQLHSTGIPLDELAVWFAAIPARQLICVLDCCFSGGMGARVLKVDNRFRGITSAETLLEQLSGEGRLILTAASASEAALENQRLRHGLLTHAVLQALQGAEEVTRAGKISVYRLLEYVTQHVIDAAALQRHEQHPTLKGNLVGELIWPVFRPGRLWREAFPEQVQTHVTAEIGGLQNLGYPAEIVSAWAHGIPTLNQLQLDAINEFGVLDGEHLVVSAPTSSGKTMVGELVAIKGALERRRSLFLLPLKALVNDKHQQFRQLYGPYGIRTIRATGEISDELPSLMRGQYDICLLTYEKFASLVLGSPHILNQVSVVIVDEVQMIADESRGINLEFILTLLRMRRTEGIEPQLIALSAVIGDTNGLERWLDARLLRRVERPVPLDEGVLLRNGDVRFCASDTRESALLPAFIRPELNKGSSQDWVIPLVRKLAADEGKQVIVFRETRGEARGCALYLAKALGLRPAVDTLHMLPSGDLSGASEALRSALSGGVAFHISDLDRDERLLIEQQFRKHNSDIRVIVATTTLAMGVNTPAEVVVVVGLEHPGPTPYSVAEYKNIVGRAGRLGFASRGSSFLLALTPREEQDFWSGYIQGVPENLQSQLFAKATDPRSLIVRVLAGTRRSARRNMSGEDIARFLESSFGAFQQAQLSEQWRWDRGAIDHALRELCHHGLVHIDQEGLVALTELGWLAGTTGVEVESVVRLVEALTPVSPEFLSDPTLLTATQLTVELDQIPFPMNKKSTFKEPQKWRAELHRQGVPRHILSMLDHAPDLVTSTQRAKKSVACLLWISEMPMAEIEQLLTQFGQRSGGAAGPVRQVATRTCDLLPVVGRIAEILHPELDLGTRIRHLWARLQVGTTGPLVEVATHLGNNLTRADYQSLMRAGLVRGEDLACATDEVLLSCVGHNVAKLHLLREAMIALRERTPADLEMPLIPLYEG